MPLPPQLKKRDFDQIPDEPGVYFFSDADGELLYVGKSVHLQKRVRSHFHKSEKSTKHRRLFKQTASINWVRTAGDLGACLLELQYIKECQPLLNKQSRKKKRLVVAKEAINAGYKYPKLQRANQISINGDANVLGVFRSKQQARGVFEDIAREYELCRQRLQVTTKLRDGACFYRQLGQCRGACVGDEPTTEYNRRFDKAFAKYAIKTWPFEASVAIREEDNQRTDIFLIDSWRIKEAKIMYPDKKRDFFASVPFPSEFNYDTYKQIARFVLSDDNYDKIEFVNRYESTLSNEI